MNPLEAEKSILYAVTRLVRTWLKFKYNVNLGSLPLACGGSWDNSVIHHVLNRVNSTVATLDTGTECRIQLTSKLDNPSFVAATNFIRDNSRASVLPPLIVRTKNGNWVVVVNSGNHRLQGYSSNLQNTDYAFVDYDTFETACPVFDIAIVERRPRWLVCCSSIPRTTALFRSKIDDVFRQTELDSALLDDCDDYESVLS